MLMFLSERRLIFPEASNKEFPTLTSFKPVIVIFLSKVVCGLSEITRELVSKFEKQNGSIICKELLEGSNLKVEVAGKPEERTNEYYKKRPCDELVYDAAKILEDYLKEKGII